MSLSVGERILITGVGAILFAAMSRGFMGAVANAQQSALPAGRGSMPEGWHTLNTWWHSCVTVKAG